MRLARVKNAKRNIVWGGIERITSIVLPFVVRTVFLKILGDEILGLNGLFSAILQVLNLAELGFSNAVVYNMYKPIAEDDTAMVCALMNYYKKVYHIIGSCVFAIGIILIPFLPRLIKGEIPQGYNLYVLYIIYLFNTCISYFLFAYKNSLLNAHQRDDINSKVAVIISIATHVLQLAVLLLFNSYYIYLVVLPLMTISSNLIKAYYASKLFPNYKCSGAIPIDLHRTIRKNVLGLFIGKACIVSRNSFDSIFLSAFVGLTTVAIYGNYYYIMTAITGILLMFRNSINAGIGNSIAMNSIDKNHSDFELLSFLYAWLSGWCTVCFLVLYQPFMQIWVGDNMMFPFSTVILICTYFYSLSLGDIRSIYSNAAGLFWEGRYYVITEAVMNVILNYVLGKLFGVNGIILATNLTIICINFVWGSRVLYKYYFKGLSVTRFYLRHIVYAFTTFVVSFITLTISNVIPYAGWSGFILKGLICVVVPNVLFWVVYRRHPNYSGALSLMKRIIKN